jgi:hypothetical protein
LPAFPSAEAPWDSWFHDFHVDKPIVVSTEDLNKHWSEYSIRLLADIGQVDLMFRQQIVAMFNVGFIQPGTSAPPEFNSLTNRILEFATTRNGATSRVYNVYSQQGIRTAGLPEQASVPSVFRPSRQELNLNEFAQQFGQLEVQGRIPTLVKNVNMIEPRLKDISMIFTPGGPALYGDIGLGRLLPIRVMGEGTSKLASLMVDVTTATDGALLIDEIENGFHYSVLEKLWAAIDQATVSQNVQFFATTHSLECIAAAHRYFTNRMQIDDESTPEFRLFRLERNGNAEQTKAVSLDLEAVGNALELGFEVR